MNIFAVPPKKPKMNISGSELREGELADMSCTTDARPPAKLVVIVGESNLTVQETIIRDEQKDMYVTMVTYPGQVSRSWQRKKTKCCIVTNAGSIGACSAATTINVLCKLY